MPQVLHLKDVLFWPTLFINQTPITNCTKQLVSTNGRAESAHNYEQNRTEYSLFTNSKSRRASFLFSSLSTCDKKLSPTHIKNFEDLLITAA